MSTDFVSTIAATVISSGTLWGGLQWVMSRRERKAQEKQKEAEAQKAMLDALKAEDERRELLATAQVTAQKAALDSAAERFNALHADYMECRDGLRGVCSAAFLLIDAISTILGRVRPNKDSDDYSATLTSEELTKARFALDEARKQLH